jgi:hypothetical protein
MDRRYRYAVPIQLARVIIDLTSVLEGQSAIFQSIWSISARDLMAAGTTIG